MTTQLSIDGLNGWRECTICDKKFRGFSSMSDHSKESHPQEVRESNLWYAEQNLASALNSCRLDFDIAVMAQRDDVPASIKTILHRSRSHLSNTSYTSGAQRYGVTLVIAEEEVSKRKTELNS